MTNEYICVKNTSPENVRDGLTPNIFRGDVVKLLQMHIAPQMEGGVGYEFVGHEGYMYSCTLFLPLPDRKVYHVSVSETIRQLPEPQLN